MIDLSQTVDGRPPNRWIRIGLTRIRIGLVEKMHPKKQIKQHFFSIEILMLQKNTYYCTTLFFMCVQQKFNFYFQKYYVLVIFVDYLREFPTILADFLLPRSTALLLHQTQKVEMVRI